MEICTLLVSRRKITFCGVAKYGSIFYRGGSGETESFWGYLPGLYPGLTRSQAAGSSVSYQHMCKYVVVWGAYLCVTWGSPSTSMYRGEVQSSLTLGHLIQGIGNTG